MANIFLTGGSMHDFKRDLAQVVVSDYIRRNWAVQADTTIAAGSSNGNLTNNAANVPVRIDGLLVGDLSEADNFWNLTGETALTAGQYRAIWLYSDGTIAAGGTVTSNETQALANLPTYDDTKAIVAVYMGGAGGAGQDFTAALPVVVDTNVFKGLPVGAPISVDERLAGPIESVNVLNM